MKEWVRLQKNLYLQLKREAERLLHVRPKSLKSYENRFLKDLKTLSEVESWEFFKHLQDADVFLIGDFHTLRQSQRSLLRLLKDPRSKLPRSLGLEVLLPEHSKAVAKAMKGRDFDKLKNILQLERRFGSSFDTYREIFEVCMQRKVEIVPLGSNSPSLLTRDRSAAKQISKAAKPHWALMGEFHCARAHLPTEILKSHPSLQLLILQQNPESEGLRSMGNKKTIFLKAPRSATQSVPLFAILHTPLWMKWQSFVERHQFEHDQSAGLSEEVDARDQISWCVETLHHFLEDARYPLPYSFEEISDFEVLKTEEEGCFRKLQQLPRQAKKSVLQQLSSGNSAVASAQRKLFLSELTFNSCAHASASYLFRRCSQIENDDQDFFRGTLVETMSFFLSKVLNHSRRSLSWQDWKALLKTPQRFEAEALFKAEQFPFRFADRTRWLKSIGSMEVKARQHLGRILADSLFEAFLAQEFSKSRLSRFMTEAVTDEKEAFERLVEIKSVGNAFAD